MSNEIARITKLFEEKKISEEEYSKLLSSIKEAPKQSGSLKRFLVDPFAGLSLVQSIILSVVILLLLSLLGNICGVHYPGAFDIQHKELSFAVLLLQNVLIVLVTGLFFFLGALLAGGKNIRIIDIVTSLSIARYPYIVATLFIVLYSKVLGLNMKDLSSVLLIVPVMLACLVWLGVLYFKAMKYSFGLRAKSLWIIFVIGLLLSEATTIVTNQKTITGFSLAGQQVELADSYAKDSADGWLKLIDDKKYEQNWKETAVYFQKHVALESWVNTLKSGEEKTGQLVTRKYYKTETDKDNKKVKTVMYHSSYSIMGDVVEQVVLRQQKNGEWKVVGYWLK